MIDRINLTLELLNLQLENSENMEPENLAKWLGRCYNDLNTGTLFLVSTDSSVSAYYDRGTDTWYKKVFPSREDLPNFPLGINAQGKIALGKDSHELLLESFYQKLPRAPHGLRAVVNRFFAKQQA